MPQRPRRPSSGCAVFPFSQFIDIDDAMFKKFFSAGLLVWVPLAITFWALESIIRWSDSLVQLLPPEFRPDALIGFHIPGIGLVLAIALILVTGIFAANVIGRWVVARWGKTSRKIPLVRPIYSGVKQIMETVLSNRTESFKEVVLIEFPKRTVGHTASSSQHPDALQQPKLVMTMWLPYLYPPHQTRPRATCSWHRVHNLSVRVYQSKMPLSSTCRWVSCHPNRSRLSLPSFRCRRAPTVRRSNNAAKKVSTPF